MAIELSEQDHNKLDELIEKILDDYRDDEVSRSAAVGAIMHLVAAAAKDNDGEIQSWAHKVEVYDRWKAGIQKR